MSKRPRKAYLHEDGSWRLPLTRGQEAILDEVDVAFAEQWCWCANKPKTATSYYAFRGIAPHKGGGTVTLHREIATLSGLDVSGHIDHKNLNGLDNRRDNLRSADHSQNKCNTELRADNVSGVKGVSFHAYSGLYRAQVTKKGVGRYTKYFARFEDAEAAVAKARAAMHAEFARSE